MEVRWCASMVRAAAFAAAAHAGQVRKFTGAPHITHPRAVAALFIAHDLPEAVSSKEVPTGCHPSWPKHRREQAFCNVGIG
jgi:hypothetical protein